jgi:hypothetical protein
MSGSCWVLLEGLLAPEGSILRIALENMSGQFRCCWWDCLLTKERAQESHQQYGKYKVQRQV